MKISYDGSGYSGWQVQPGEVTIQSEIERSLKIVLKEKIKITCAGRTDAGVHALAQVAHFDFENDVDPYTLRRSLNGLLADDIRILEVKEADKNFHARKSALKKNYIYLLSDDSVASPLLKNRVYYYFRKLDIPAMREAAERLIGEHDFRSFQAYDCNSATSVRNVYDFSIDKKEILGFTVIEFSIVGSGFLKHMVRNISGTIIEVGAKKITLNKFIDILGSRDRINAGPTAPARGLYLKEVVYQEGSVL